ncbi:Ltp family lipoprotein [Clostridium frigoris]|uniref:Ltp family lipoprotein n=1 Tax=Clostridium frigoris TaxID=205327 RepID=A0ABS6BXC5_9CLOT|nr:Ltp family lipoprotein [Clostridium frigoris]MBU3161245.1 Ltp family lipoprotein [Clostridium frigoris]
MSKLVKCKACDKEISKSVKRCPSCGHDQRNFFGKHKILTGLAIIVLLVAISNSGNKSATTTPVADSDSTTMTTTAEPAKPTVPTEYISALASAEIYGTTMNMSKDGIYNQLTSSAGDKFSPKSAQYAVDNVKIDYNANALKSAETYQKSMNMSPSAIYDQLISSAGDKFTPSEAQYAKDNLK